MTHYHSRSQSHAGQTMRRGIALKRAVNQFAFMEKDTPQPKTQPSGNQPPPRPPARTAIGMQPEDEDPEKNRRRHIQRETVRINLPALPLARPIIPQLLPPTASTEKPRLTFPDIGNLQSKWPVIVLLILAIWSIIGAIASTLLYSAYSDTFNWGVSRSVDVILLLIFLGLIFISSRNSKIHARNPLG